MSGCHNYDLFPATQISDRDEDCLLGWSEIFAELGKAMAKDDRPIIAIECYPGVVLNSLREVLAAHFADATVVDVGDAYLEPASLEDQFGDTLTLDPVFGRLNHWTIDSYFDDRKAGELRKAIDEASGLVFLIGSGTTRVFPEATVLIHGSVTRWELQRRQRNKKIGNLGFDNLDAPPERLYKNAFFLEWRVADMLRHEHFDRFSYFIDMDDQDAPRMVAGDLYRAAVKITVSRPFRVVPFFDPGPWGGTWMKKTFDLPDGPPNYAWCFDCVPEENSVCFGFGERTFRLPAITLVHEEPTALLGSTIVERFGAEFPIRFDLLDTVEGGNLSLQVHPLRQYIQEHFGISYTQDESYYILDCEPGAELYLGLRNEIDRAEMCADLESAQEGLGDFPAERYVNTWPTQKHDHFSIPAGTVHCSGSGNLVLEISATPYIFTFKLWDWGRLGLNGRPRPIHLQHGLANIQWDRDCDWVQRELLNTTETIGRGPLWEEQRTGLHKTEFIETRRHWFTGPVAHDTRGTLQVLNLVEGEAAIVESPSGAFLPFEVHYAETFIIPASVGEYTVRPLRATAQPLGTIKAYVRG